MLRGLLMGLGIWLALAVMFMGQLSYKRKVWKLLLILKGVNLLETAHVIP